MTEKKPGVSIGLGEGAVDLLFEEARDLARLHEHPGWRVLRILLKGMMDGTTVALRDREKGLEDLRFCQGQADVAGRIADIVEDEIPSWYKEGTVALERESEGSGENDA